MDEITANKRLAQLISLRNELDYIIGKQNKVVDDFLSNKDFAGKFPSDAYNDLSKEYAAKKQEIENYINLEDLQKKKNKNKLIKKNLKK